MSPSKGPQGYLTSLCTIFLRQAIFTNHSNNSTLFVRASAETLAVILSSIKPNLNLSHHRAYLFTVHRREALTSSTPHWTPRNLFSPSNFRYTCSLQPQGGPGPCYSYRKHCPSSTTINSITPYARTFLTDQPFQAPEVHLTFFSFSICAINSVFASLVAMGRTS